MRSNCWRLLTGLLASACALLIQPVLAATLYGTTGSGSTLSTLVEINPATGALVRTIGPVGYTVNGLTSDRSTGTLYATTAQKSPTCPRGLLTINTATGAGTIVGCGPLTGEGPSLLTSSPTGRLYSWLESSTDDLILWNKATGTYGAPIGDSGLSTGGHTLSFSISGTLYLLQDNDLYTINTATGASTSIGTVTGVPGSQNHGDFSPDDNLLYAVSDFDTSTVNLVVIDVATRTQLRSVPTVTDLHTLAFSGPPAVAAQVPVDSPWALAVVALILAAFGASYLRRRA